MQYCRIELFSVIDPFHPGRYRGKNLIGNRTQPTGHLFYGQLLAEYLDTVSFPTIDVGYIYQGYVHTDITDDRSTLAIDDDTPFAIAEMPVKPVGISYGNSRYTGRSLQHPATTVSDRFSGSQIAYLQNRRLQRTYRA